MLFRFLFRAAGWHRALQAVQHRRPRAFGNHGFRLGVALAVNVQQRVQFHQTSGLMRYSSNNLNQLTRRVHETGRIYDTDLEDISQRQEQLWEGVREILTQLSKLS